MCLQSAIPEGQGPWTRFGESMAPHPFDAPSSLGQSNRVLASPTTYNIKGQQHILIETQATQLFTGVTIHIS